jgi:hypothetical protein
MLRLLGRVVCCAMVDFFFYVAKLLQLRGERGFTDDIVAFAPPTPTSRRAPRWASPRRRTRRRVAPNPGRATETAPCSTSWRTIHATAADELFLEREQALPEYLELGVVVFPPMSGGGRGVNNAEHLPVWRVVAS